MKLSIKDGTPAVCSSPGNIPRESAKADVRLDQERHSGGLQSPCQRLQALPVSTAPKCGTGTSWPSTGLCCPALTRPGCGGLRWQTSWCAVEIEIDGTL